MTKTDEKDDSWIEKSLRVDFVPKNFVPEEPLQDLRELTRLRKMWIESRNRKKIELIKFYKQRESK